MASAPSDLAPGWPLGAPGAIVNARVGRNRVAIPVHRGIAFLVVALVRDIEREVGELAHTGWCWGYFKRIITGGNTWSFHAYGVCFDFNAPNHPYGRSHTWGRHEATVIRIAHRYGFRCGAEYGGTKDDMHFEFLGTPREAALRTAALAGAPAPAPTPPPPAQPAPVDLAALRRALAAHYAIEFAKQPDLNFGSPAGLRVALLQTVLNFVMPNTNLVVDGKYGPATIMQVTRWQKFINGLEPKNSCPEVGGESHRFTRYFLVVGLQRIRDGLA